MSLKIKVNGDNSSNPFHSSRIIISALNNGAKNVDLYDEDGVSVVYDILCNHHGHNPKAILTAYEMAYPKIVIQNAQSLPLIGFSRDNMTFILEGGHPSALVDFCHLGVDSKLWKRTKQKSGGKFRFLCVTDSNVRSCVDILVSSFCLAFKGSKDVELYIKDREPTPVLQAWIKEQATNADVNIIHDPRHTENHEIEKDIYSSADCHIYLNHSTTWGMTVMQGMSMGLPTISVAYSGPRDYINDRMNGLAVDFDLQSVTPSKLHELEQKGLRNFLFPPTWQYYTRPPYWAEPKIESVVRCMKEMYEDKDFREELGERARKTAECFTWERAAINLSYILSKWY